MPAESASHHALAETLKEIFTPLIRKIVAEAPAAQCEADPPKLGDGKKLAYFEEEAARMLGMKDKLQLARQRRNGHIKASVKGPRGRPMYTQDDLDGYAQRTPNEEEVCNVRST